MTSVRAVRGSGGLTAPPSSRTKNPSRVAPSILVSEPVTLGKVVGCEVYGHVSRPGVLVPEMKTADAAIEGVDLEVLLVPEDVPPIPPGAEAPTEEGEFYSFATIYPVLFVAFGGGSAAVPDVLQALIAKGSVASVKEIARTPDTVASYTFEGQGQVPLYPWADFKDVCAAKPEYTLSVVLLSDVGASPVVASALVARQAFVATAFTSPDTPAPRTRVRPQPLKWLKDSETAREVAAIVDQMPGVYRRRDPEFVRHFACTPMSGVVYDRAFDVARQLLSWGIFAAWVSRNASPEDVEEAPEPLRSYMIALRHSEESRFGKPKDAAAAPADPALSLAFNTARKISAEQQEHAMRVFYWAAVHEDDDTRPINKDHARRILDIYVTACGTVILKKRAYNFQASATGGKRTRNRKHIEDDD